MITLIAPLGDLFFAATGMPFSLLFFGPVVYTSVATIVNCNVILPVGVVLHALHIIIVDRVACLEAIRDATCAELSWNL